MFISWLGNSSFLIKTSLGKRLLIDPINKFHSCQIKTLNPNLITLSSTTFKCNCLSNIDSNTTLISTPEIFDTDLGIINGFKTFADNINGLKRGENIIYTYNIDDIKLCHLGYLGHLLDDSLIELLQGYHIIFLPIGGNMTLNSKEAFKLMKKLNSTFVIPMSYKFNSSSFLFESANNFLKLSKNLVSTPLDNFHITKELIDAEPSKNNIIILSPTASNTI